MKRVGALISPVINRLGLEEAVTVEGLQHSWGSLFREPLSLHTFPAALKNGELLMTVDSSAWLHELTFLKSDLLKRLQPLGVKDIRFRIGRVRMRKPTRVAEGRYERRQLRKEDLGEIERVSSAIPDTALRERIRKAMEVSFSAQKPRGPENQGGRDSPPGKKQD